jgi:hypothetical protein
MLYIPSMILRSRLGSLSLVLVLLANAAACGGRTVTRRSAEKLLVSLPSGILDEKDVEVLGVTQISSNNAIVDTRVRAAFALEKVDGKWVVRQVRVGNEQWESIDNLRAALNRINRTVQRKERPAPGLRQLSGIVGRPLPRLSAGTATDGCLASTDQSVPGW